MKVGALFLLLVLATVGLALLAAGCQSARQGENELVLASLEPATANGKPTIAEFGRGTCIPCKEMKPILEDLAVEYEGRLNVAIISVDEYRALTSQYGIMAIPTQVFLDASGKEVARHVGFLPRKDIIAQLEKLGFE